MAFLKEQILAHSDVTVFVSEKSRRGFFGPAPPEGRSMQLYPPVRSEVLDPPPAADRSFPGIPDSLFSVVFLGMVLRHKGVHDFVSAGLKALRVNPGLHFTIAGARPDPGYDERLRQTVAASGREDRFLFVDFIENPLPLYDRADVVSMPSLYEEPCGLVISEAMSRGKAVVAYETGSIRELIRDGEDGFIVPRGDVRALAERVEFLERNRSACRKLGERAAKTARRRAAPGPWAGRVQEVIQRVIARA
jgi:glycosyltransferase involved in cell wall biosynthesis